MSIGSSRGESAVKKQGGVPKDPAPGAHTAIPEKAGIQANRAGGYKMTWAEPLPPPEPSPLATREGIISVIPAKAGIHALTVSVRSQAG